MASNPEINPPRTAAAETRTSETDQPPTSAAHYPPPGGAQSTMNYAHPQQGYPVPPPYQGYPNATYNPYYHQDLNAAYYGTAAYSPADEAANSFVRCFCIIMFLLLLLALLASLIMFAVVKPEKPNFKVESFTVSNFNLVPENKIVSGKWEASVYLDNPSYRLRLNIDRLETSLYHKDDYLAAGPLMQPMDMDAKAKGTKRVKMETYNTTASGAVDDMVKEQKEGGNVSFNLRLTLYYATRSYGWFYHNYYKSGTLRVKCPDLKVALPVGTNTGNMQGGSKGCDVSDDS